MDELAQGALGATFVFPFVAAFGAWRLARRLRHRWLIHLLVLPSLLAGDWLLLLAFDWTVGDDGETPALGLVLIPIAISLAVALAGYYLALGVTAVVGLGRAPSDTSRPRRCSDHQPKDSQNTPTVS